MFKKLFTKKSKVKTDDEDIQLKSPEGLPNEVVLLKDLPGVKAGVTFTLSPDGYYFFQSSVGYAAYDWYTVTNLIDWFRPVGVKGLGRWFDGSQ